MTRREVLRHARGELSLDHCLVMGIVNRTPDSFYDGGRMSLRSSLAHAHRLIEQGADILDLGAIKAGPGSFVDESTELDRLLPLVTELAAAPIITSVETGRPAVARAALEAGAELINDVSGLRNPELAGVCAEFGAAVVLMHHGGQIRGRPRHPRYRDVVADVIDEWQRLAVAANNSGIDDDRIVVDPGLDFGKTTLHSLELLRRIPELVKVQWPVLLAASRKDVVGETLGVPPDERLEGSLAAAAVGVWGGVAIVRAHDVRATVRTVRMVEAVLGRRDPATMLRGLWD
jgi:dihydropteroate synthase